MQSASGGPSQTRRSIVSAGRPSSLPCPNMHVFISRSDIHFPSHTPVARSYLFFCKQDTVSREPSDPSQVSRRPLRGRTLWWWLKRRRWINGLGSNRHSGAWPLTSTTTKKYCMRAGLLLSDVNISSHSTPNWLFMFIFIWSSCDYMPGFLRIWGTVMHILLQTL